VRFLLTTGDNIYAGSKLLGIPIGETGREDDDWFFTYFQPYRYVINRIPVYPSIGNHDASESEECDDRGQVEDNFYMCERMAAEEATGYASFKPGLFYRFRFGADIEFVCIDTSREGFFKSHRLFEFPKHWTFVEAAFPSLDSAGAGPRVRWRIPFSHHPPYSAGPRHHNTTDMERLLPLFARSGVKVVFSGHEHTFQHSRAGGIDYLVSGAGGKVRRRTPDRFEDAHTQSWSAECHFLLARIEGTEMVVRPIGEMPAPGALTEIERFNPSGERALNPISIQVPVPAPLT
jgi:hypothetical protein